MSSRPVPSKSGSRLGAALLGLACLILAGCSSTSSPSPSSSGSIALGSPTGGLTASPISIPTATPTATSTPTLPPVIPVATPSHTPAPSHTAKPITTTPAPKSATLYLRLWSMSPSIGPFNFFDISKAISNLYFYHMPIGSAFPPSPQLYISPVRQSITQASIDAIVTAASVSYGLLGQTTHAFVCPGPQWPVANAPTTYIQMTVNSTTYHLSGTCNAQYTPDSSPQSGTYDAFVAFVAKLNDLANWPGIALGSETPWNPTAMAVDAALPAEAWWEPDMSQPSSNGSWNWSTYANLGTIYDPGDSCGVLSGPNNQSLLSEIQGVADSTLFLDLNNESRVLALRPLMPGEPTTGSGICP